LNHLLRIGIGTNGRIAFGTKSAALSLVAHPLQLTRPQALVS
jgi:hypothetical protein